MNARQERWDRYFTAALAGATGRVSDASGVAARVADEALAEAEGRCFPKAALDKLLEAANAIDNAAIYADRDGTQGHWMPAVFVIALRKALAELKGDPQ